jgi:cytidylate kinase
MAIITISRGTFSGGEDLAKCIAERLGYGCIAREVLVEAAKDYGADEGRLHKALVERPGLLERLTSDRAHYIALVQAALCKLVKNDNVVYHGHAGHLLLRGVPHVLRVRVIANMELRVRSAMYREGFTRTQAIDHVDKMDKARAKWTKFLYRVDWQDPSLYDLIVNVDVSGVSSACRIVCTAAGLDEFRTTRESQRVMDDLALGTEVKARIVADETITSPGIDVTATDGLVTVSGTVGSSEEVDRIGEIVRNTPGVRGVRSTVRTETHWALAQGRYMR